MGPKVSPAALQRRIHRLAHRQYGCVSREQLLRLGLGPDAVKHRLRSGRLSLLHRGVYAVGPAPGTQERRWAAALLACGEGAVLSHVSAAALWHLRAVDPAVIDGLRRHEPGTTRTKNLLEETFLMLVREAGLPQPEVNTELGPYEIDFLCREQRLAVETDGGASHDRASARERDAGRGAWLATNDYECLRFTWRQVTELPGEVLGALRAKL
jgi:very-short-patch-repair endonuclease